jgi:hypothetical protein
MTRGLGRYAAVLVGLLVVGGFLMSLAFRGPGDATAIAVSAAVALVVQVGAAMLGGAVGKANVQARMGAGALIRFLALIAYALLVAFAIKLPLNAALISLAVFFFVTTLIEPLLIKS